MSIVGKQTVTGGNGLSIYRYIHPDIQATIALFFTVLLTLFAACNLKRMHRLKTFCLFALTLGMLASAFVALAYHYDWPCKDRLLLVSFTFYGLSMVLGSWHDYKFGSRERRVVLTQELLIAAFIIVFLSGLYLFLKWRRA